MQFIRVNLYQLSACSGVITKNFILLICGAETNIISEFHTEFNEDLKQYPIPAECKAISCTIISCGVTTLLIES